MILSTRTVERNGRGWSTGGSRGHDTLGPLNREGCFLGVRLFFWFYPKTARRSGHFFLENRSDLELARTSKEYRNQKVSKTIDLDMIKNLFVTCRCSLKIQKLYRHNTFCM